MSGIEVKAVSVICNDMLAVQEAPKTVGEYWSTSLRLSARVTVVGMFTGAAGIEEGEWNMHLHWMQACYCSQK